MKWTRQEYVDLMTYRNTGRPMFSELFGPLVGLDREWRAQGATEAMIGMEAFAFDYVPVCGIGRTGAVHTLPKVVLEDDETHYLGLDGFGRRVRMDKRTATIPLPETFPVETMDDWLRLKPMFLYDPCRVTDEEIAAARARQRDGAVLTVGIPGGFDILRELMGEENGCVAMFEDPELVGDILDTVGRTCERVIQEILSRGLVPDQLSVHEDMAGKSGPMVGPNMVARYIAPYYLRSWNLVREAGTELFCQDSDGNMNPVIDAFVEAGVNIFYPCEPAAGMDIVALRRKYGHKIAFKGGIDKHVLRRSAEEIDEELAYKLQPCVTEGGVVLGLDHRIPNGTPLPNYVHYVNRAREMLGMPPYEACPPSWGRMAF